MILKTGNFRVKIRFKDPDNLPGSFQTDDYLSAAIIAAVPGPWPNTANWILRLDAPIYCYDARGQHHTAQTFLLAPDGLDAEAAMRQPPWESITEREIGAMVSLLTEGLFPARIDSVEEYRNYPYINHAMVVLEVKPGLLRQVK